MDPTTTKKKKKKKKKNWKKKKKKKKNWKSEKKKKAALGLKCCVGAFFLHKRHTKKKTKKAFGCTNVYIYIDIHHIHMLTANTNGDSSST
mgnify:CR=1 FL=1